MPGIERHHIILSQWITFTSSGDSSQVTQTTSGGGGPRRELLLGPEELWRDFVSNVVIRTPQFDRIVEDPDICMGAPTVRGTRITAEFVYRMIKSGMEIAEIKDAYPQLKQEDIGQAVEFIDRKQLQQAA